MVGGSNPPAATTHVCSIEVPAQLSGRHFDRHHVGRHRLALLGQLLSTHVSTIALQLLNEAALVERARKGERGAFDELVKRTYADTYTLAFRLTGNEHDARDVAQDVYVRAFRSLPRFRGEARVSTWLYRITANCAATTLSRNSKRRHAILDDGAAVADTSMASDPFHQTQVREEQTAVEALLLELPPRMRAVVVLRDVYELSHEDIARELGISETAAKVRLHRARRKLRDLLAERGNALGFTGVETGDGDFSAESRF